MKVNYNELQIAIDVDQTLIMHGMEHRNDVIQIKSPYLDKFICVVPHTMHIEILKNHFARGYYITVHSNNGAKWAENVVRALGLTAYVHECKSKYIKFIDDKDSNDCMGTRLYFDFEKKI